MDPAVDRDEGARDVAGVVFVMIAHFSNIGKLREFHIQHGFVNTGSKTQTRLNQVCQKC